EDSLIYALRSAQMVSVQNKVKVEGLKQLTLANKLGSLDGSKAFLPLGPSPETGDFMVIGSSEVFSKKVASGKLKMNWKINQSFSGKTWASAWTNISILDKNNWVRPKQPRVDYLQFTSLLNGSVFEFNHEALIGKEESDVYTTQSHSGFLKFLLYNTMGHETYPTQYLRQAMKIAKNPDTSETLPEKPYVPEIDGISIDYTTSWEELKLTKTNKEVSDKLEFYHITPFGTHPAHGNDLDQDNPNFVWNAANEGELFVGFKDSVPGSSLNVLFSIVEGSSNPLKKAPDVKWSYLEDNQWKSFETDKLIDSTNGLIQTGIVTAEIPLRFKDPGTHMGSDLFWIKAEVSQDPDAVCNILAISAQAFSATLFCEEIAEGHFEEPLEEGTVKKFLDPITGIKKIHQPLASFGGKKKEDEATFKNRISQRSRHKDRSVEMLDYEQLVLQEFDEIKRVRCITHTKYEENETTGVVDYSESAPGHITLITLPNFWDKDEIKRYTAISTLENVKSHLQAKLSPFVNLHVKNPIYYEVRLEFNVKFNDDILEKEFYKAQLHAELIEFLSPFNSGVRKTIFQSTINKAEVIDFIDERHYVNYLKNLVMDVIIDPLKPSENQLNIETAKTNIQAALLVSAKEHTIKVIT
ncbi:MAG: hypothetical protein N4A46_12545, partial [Schleiferiaceae bacterium]|nr:hypothetical protein [Schleiferiaceae bacterium]